MDDELSEHKALFRDLQRAKTRRVKAQNEMFAAPRQPNQFGVLSTAEFERATDSEREIGSQLQTLGNEARDRLHEMLRAQSEGQRIDQKEAARLSAVVNEINADLAAVLGDAGRPVPGPIGRAA